MGFRRSHHRLAQQEPHLPAWPLQHPEGFPHLQRHELALVRRSPPLHPHHGDPGLADANQPRHGQSQAIVPASLHPSVVSLTAIASPYWAKIAHSHRPDLFLDRIRGQVTEGRTPRGAHDPLRPWVNEDWDRGIRGSDTTGPSTARRIMGSARTPDPAGTGRRSNPAQTLLTERRPMGSSCRSARESSQSPCLL